MQVTKWHHRREHESTTPYIVPKAQDSQAEFLLTEADLRCVALTTIDGLNQKLEERHAEIRELKRELARLKEIVNKLATHTD